MHRYVHGTCVNCIVTLNRLALTAPWHMRDTTHQARRARAHPQSGHTWLAVHRAEEACGLPLCPQHTADRPHTADPTPCTGNAPSTLLSRFSGWNRSGSVVRTLLFCCRKVLVRLFDGSSESTHFGDAIAGGMLVWCWWCCCSVRLRSRRVYVPGESGKNKCRLR